MKTNTITIMNNIVNIQSLVNKVYPIIAKDYNSNAKVELHSNIYERLDSISAMEEYESYAEYSLSNDMIYLYTDHLDNEEDVIRSLIHECVHSNQLHELYAIYYEECDLDYDTHPYEIEAEYEEENWKKYKL